MRPRNAGVACGLENLIAHNEQGYYFGDWITIHDADDGNVPVDDPQMTLQTRRSTRDRSGFSMNSTAEANYDA